MARKPASKRASKRASKPRAKGGRPPKISKQVREDVVKAIKAGAYAEVAARSAGISETTYYRWMKQGDEENSGQYREFREAVKKAEAEMEVLAGGLVVAAFREDWKAAMTYLERKFPERWSRSERRVLTGEDGGPVRITEEAFLDPKVREVLNEAARRLSVHR
jgi:transposase-like protein